MYVCDKVTKDASIDRKGEKRSLWLLNPSRSEIIGKNVAAYAAERLVSQETFLKLKIHGL